MSVFFGICFLVLGTLIVIINFMNAACLGSTSHLSENDVMRHIDYLIGFLLISAGAIIIAIGSIISAIQKGSKHSQQESQRLAAIDEMRKNIDMPSPRPLSCPEPKKKQPMTAKDRKIGVIITVVFVIIYLILCALKALAE